MKKIDMHVHTSGASFCSEVSGKMATDAYKKAGLDGIVLTNHYSVRHFEYFGHDYDSAIKNYVDEYHRVKKVFESAGMSAYLGVEVEMSDGGTISDTTKNHEFLLYGANEEFLFENPKLYDMTQKNLYLLCHKNNILMFQAHPFREEQGHHPADPEFLDGTEINTHPKYKWNVERLFHFADKYDLSVICGSDMHYVTQAGDAVTILPKSVTDNAALAEYLKKTQRPEIIYANSQLLRKSV